MEKKILFLLCILSVALATDWTSVGKGKIVPVCGPTWDNYVGSPSASTIQFMNDKLYRILHYEPFFDTRTSWYPRAMFYKNSYAIYPDQSDFNSVKQYILKDAYGNYVYIPWGCSGGECPAYAADISSAGWRNYWIQHAQATLNGASSPGYMGIFVDDVNLQSIYVSNGNGDLVTPMDPNTGALMTYDNWRKYFAEWMETVRAQIPAKYEIVHNTAWFAGPDGVRDQDPYVLRQIKSATNLNKEFGVIDAGLRGGNGVWSLRNFFSYVDRMHALGKAVTLEATISNDQERLYNLACYYLITNGNDRHDNSQITPDLWYSIYDYDFGSPLGDRYDWNGLIRRDFTNGIILVNEPEAQTKTVTIPSGYTDENDTPRTSITLAASSGIVLKGATSSTSTGKVTTTSAAATTGDATTAPSITTGDASTTGSVISNGVGKPHMAKHMNANFDPFLSDDSTKSWMNTHFDRISTYSPMWDTYTWYSKGWFIVDPLAVYDFVAQYVLKDSAGNPLWMPWGCNNGACAAYAADVSNAGYRSNWVNNVMTSLNTGNYKGVFITNVVFGSISASDGDGNLVTPFDSNTGADMTLDDWNNYLAEFFEYIRAQVPSQYEIVHDSVWSTTPDSYMQRSWASSDLQNVGSGALVSDPVSLFDYVDQLHALGKHVILSGDNIVTDQDRDFNFASYLLVTDGSDYHDNSIANPDNWWIVYDTDFGSALNDRYEYAGAWRRDFIAATVLVNAGTSATTVDLGVSMTDYNGNTASSVTLQAQSATILWRDGYKPGQACIQGDCSCDGSCESGDWKLSASIALVAGCVALLL